MSAIDRFDNTIIYFLNQFAAKNQIMDTAIVDFADSAIVKGGLFMAYFWWLWFKTDDGIDVNIRRRVIVTSVLGAIVAAFISRILQFALPFHTRPLHTATLGFTLPFGVDPRSLNYWNSFPSDHAVFFFALSTAVWFQSRRLGALAMLWSLFAICLPRLYLGYHYPSDIIAGAVLGVLLMMWLQRLIGRSAIPDALLRLEITHRMAFYCCAFLATYELAVLFYDLRHLALDSIRIAKAVVMSIAWASGPTL